MAIKKVVDGESDQHQAEVFGLVDSPERRIEDKGKPKSEGMCKEEGCYEPLGPAQTEVCAKHIRAG